MLVLWEGVDISVGVWDALWFKMGDFPAPDTQEKEGGGKYLTYFKLVFSSK